MADRLKEILARIKAWWSDFTARQKTVIIAIAATVIFTFVLVLSIISKPQYIKLGTYSSAAESSRVVDILNDAGITHKESSDALTIEVVKKQEYQAHLALGSAGIVTDKLKYGDYVDNSITTTSADKQMQQNLYKQAELERILEAQANVKKATVILNIPPQYGTLIERNEEASAYVSLDLDGNLTSAQAAGLARCIKSALGNSTTANITIIDTDSNILFVGGDDYSTAGIANSMQELQNQAENMMANQVKRAIYGTKQYDSVEVVSHLNLDYAEYEEARKEYYANEGYTDGMKAHQSLFESSSTNQGGNVPGTDSNDGSNLDTYVWPNYGDSEASQTESDTDYLPNEWAWNKKTMPGIIKYEDSSMAISMISYRIYHEESVKRQGLLDGGLTWEDFKENNRSSVMQTVPEEYYHMAASATGISEDKITIIAYEVPVFYDKEGMKVSGTDVLSGVMILLIIALLAFVVLRSMKSRKETPEEEELSVETMLQSTPESTLEDIDVETKSETRLLIEKFVDDNPEAAANLLRNWLNEDWN